MVFVCNNSRSFGELESYVYTNHNNRSKTEYNAINSLALNTHTYFEYTYFFWCEYKVLLVNKITDVLIIHIKMRRQYKIRKMLLSTYLD